MLFEAESLLPTVVNLFAAHAVGRLPLNQHIALRHAKATRGCSEAS